MIVYGHNSGEALRFVAPKTAKMLVEIAGRRNEVLVQRGGRTFWLNAADVTFTDCWGGQDIRAIEVGLQEVTISTRIGACGGMY
jgi:hypothetical protein